MRSSAKPESLRPPPISVRRVVIALFFLWLHAIPPLVQGQQPNATEDQVKAAYLLNFAKLAEWPSRALPEGPSPLLIGVSGADEDFLAVLRAVAVGKTAGTHPLQIKAVSSASEMDFCQLIFFRSSRGRKRAAAAISSLTGAGILLVGEDEDFLQQGGMINLVRNQGSIHFEVNADALDRSGIHFSSKILALAKTGSGPASNSSTQESHTDDAKQETARPDGSRRVEHSVTPEYPEIAERMRLVGTVQVQALVRPDGTVKEVKVVGGHPVLADALVRAVRQWKYQTAPKETVESVKFSFGPP